VSLVTELCVWLRALLSNRRSNTRRVSARPCVEHLEDRALLSVGTISGLVYQDTNGDGSRQSAEPVLVSQTVQLQNSLGQTLQQTTTDANGKYTFSGLADGSYKVRDVVPAGWKVTSGTNPYSVSILNGSTASNKNFGDFKFGAFSGRVFVSETSAGLQGWTVQLLNSSGTLLKQATTDSNGRYYFASLTAGSYQVKQVPPAGWVQTVGKSVYSFSVISGTNLEYNNFGYSQSSTQLGSVTGKVFLDSNGDGIAQSSDVGQQGVTVQLLDGTGVVVKQATTDSYGAYSLTGVADGTYKVRLVSQTGYIQTAGASGYSVTIANRSTSSSINFGNFKLGTISGKLFDDTDQDGVLDSQEVGLASWTVQLFDSQGNYVQQAVTSTTGAYSFAGLLAGSYSLKVVPPVGTTATQTSSLTTGTIQSGSVLTQNVGNIIGGSVIHINDAWLAAQGPGPYLLKQANTTYVLDTDVTVDGTAFIVGAANVELDLNGHTVTYGNSAPINVTNGGFEQGTGSSVTGWDVSKASGAVLMSARYGMWGNSMLEIPNFSTTQTITSDPIQIPNANREYSATITAKGNGVSKVTLQVIDTVTGAIIASGDAADPSRGYAAAVRFTPTTTHAIKLNVIVTPQTGKVATVDLDYADVSVSRDFGIIASPSYWTFPVELQTADVVAAVPHVANFTVTNGSVRQGQGQAYGSAALNVWALNGVTVEGVTAYVDGMDSQDVEGRYAKNVLIHASTFDADVDNISNRMTVFASVHMGDNQGNVVIDGNTILGSPQTGINVFENTSGSVTITNNTISQDGIVANAYGVLLSGVTDFVIANNTIVPNTSGRGISLDAWGSDVSQGGDIYGNYVDVKELPNLEYGDTFLTATAMRVRDNGGAQRDIHIHDNTFMASNGPGGVWAAIGLRITQDNTQGLATSANMLIDHNIFKVVTTTADDNHRAWAVSISDVNGGTGLEISNNVLESNDVDLMIGDDNSFKMMNSGVLLVGNTLNRSTEGAVRTFHGVLAGDFTNSVTDIRLIDTQYGPGVTPGVDFADAAIKDVETGWLLNVVVTAADATPVAGATVQIEDGGGTVVFQGITDSNGLVKDIPVVTQTYMQTTSNPTSVVVKDNGPFQLIVNSGAKTATQAFSMGADMQLDVTI
jgi:hypothetical protein